jgi:DNA-binding NarL/FixJ family response regulator
VLAADDVSEAASTPGSAHEGREGWPPLRGDYGHLVAIRVAVGEDSLIVREGLEQLLASSPTIEIVASCSDLDSLLEAVEEHEPDVVLTDIRMPPSNSDEGIQVASQLRESHPEIGVVVLSQFSEPTYVVTLLESGSDRRGYLLKERVHNRGELVSAIDTVNQGGSVIDPKIVEVLVAAKARAERSPLSQLTPREQEVLSEIAKGKSNTAIADSLVLTKRAVEKHINSIFMKLGLASSDDMSKRVKATLLFLSEADRGLEAHSSGEPDSTG